MKYTIQIAFSEPVGDIILRVHEYAKKYGNSISHYINPLLFDFTSNGILVKRPEKKCPIADMAVFAMELYSKIPLQWATKNQASLLCDQDDVEEFFEREFSNHIFEENNVDAEMHLMFYVPLYEPDVHEYVKFILENLPSGHKFVANVIGITYDMAWACKMLPADVDKNVCKHNMIRNVSELVELTKLHPERFNTLLKHIFLFQNYNMSGWSQTFTIEKFVDVCGNLSLALVEYYDTICRHTWQDFAWEKENIQQPKPIIALNLRSEILDIYLAVNMVFRDLFKSEGQKNIINAEDIDRKKVTTAYKEILKQEIEIIRKYKSSFAEGLKEQEEYSKNFDGEIKKQIRGVVTSQIEKYCLNVSEQQYLLSLFSTITSETDFEDENFEEANWWLDEMILKELDGDDNLLEKFNQLKRCSNELSDIKEIIKEQEAIIEELHNKIDDNYPANGELTEEGYKIGNEIFKPYKCQDQPLDNDYTIPVDVKIPTSVDLRTEFPNIKNQGPQGACSAFSLVSVIEYFLHKTLLNKCDLSEAFVYYNARSISNATEQDEGATFYDIIKSIRDNGVCLEELCPYNPKVFNKQPSEEAYVEAESRKITEAKNVKISIQDIKAALAQGFPVVISARAFKTFVMNANGVISPPSPKDLQDTENNHAMVICGYTDRESYFIVRNSWGTGFGDNGYCYMPYEYVRTPNAINHAYVVTGMNVNGFQPGDLPAFDSLLRGKDFNAQYAVYLNMLHETTRDLKYNREKLDQLHKEYLVLFNQIADYSNVTLTLKDIKEQTDEQRRRLEEKLKEIAENIERGKNHRRSGLLDFFKGNYYDVERKRILKKIDELDHYGDAENRKYRIRIAILEGLKNLNQELIYEGIKLQNLSDFYEEENRRIEIQNEADDDRIRRLKELLPMGDILNAIKSTDILSYISALGSTMSRIMSGEIGLYETLSDLQSQVMNRIVKQFNFKISDFLNDASMTDFYKQISNSTIMAQIYGGVPAESGDATKYFFCNVEQMPINVDSQTENVTFLPIKDDLRMSFLHLEKYNIKDFLIFRTKDDERIVY